MGRSKSKSGSFAPGIKQGMFILRERFPAISYLNIFNYEVTVMKILFIAFYYPAILRLKELGIALYIIMLPGIKGFSE